MTDRVGKKIVLAIHINSVITYISNMYKDGVISKDEYHVRMKTIENVLIDEVKSLAKFT